MVIVVLSGTNRPGSNTLKMARMIHGFYREAGAEARILDLQDMPAELFSPASYAQKPAAFEPLSDAVLSADGLHVVTPEYNGSFPGVLKYFIDMLKFPESFEHRCVAFTGAAAGIWGGFRSVEQLQMIFGYRNAHILPERVWIPRINEKWNADQTALTDEQTMKMLRDQASKFIAFTARHDGEAAGT
ncbi:NAD(P)H-dependent oxidoreductase [Candidatus Poribacteria bacterium]|nr:NAD(P)H-dependent oxidoreductase [Candidatus Poribacteria bacterium]